MQTRRNVLLWVLYDFANSIVSIVFFLYFAQWVVVERGMSDFHFNLTFTVAAVILLFTAPLAGTIMDRFMRRITGVRISTILMAVLYSLCVFSALAEKDMLALAFFSLGLYFYLLSFTFYTPLINDITTPDKRGVVSGLGISASYLGQFVGLLVALPFSTGAIQLLNGSPRAETLLPGIILSVLFSLPMLFLFHEPKRAAGKIVLKDEVKNVLRETKEIFLVRSTAFFLASYFLFNDAILTAANNFPIFLEQVWRVTDTEKTYILLGILVTSAAGGVLAGLIADRFGHKRTLMYILAGWLFILPLVSLVTNFTWFVIAIVLMGFWFGASFAVSRSVMAYVAPAGRANLAFAYYGLSERASSFVGPIVWGLIVTNLVSLGGTRYRIAALAMTAFILLGLFVLSRVQDDRSMVHIKT